MARQRLRQTRSGAQRSTIVATTAGVCLALALLSGVALSQEKKASETPAGGPNWNTQHQTAPESSVAGIALDARQIELVKKVNDYFNSLENMRGAFLQTTADNKRLKGRFFMKKPGRIRFEYAPPSRQLIISDGQQISIQDLDINTDDRVMVDQTPFRVLLRKDVDILRDARILEVQEADDLIIVALQDKSRDSSGKVRLFMALNPALELKEWVTTDAQGLDTRLELSALDKSHVIDAALFKIVSPTLNKGQ